MQLSSWILHVWVIPLITIVECSWGSPETGQYHIQTDEGPERYFRFQTDNGQFRKEKRLQDGTVIGTEAWIDAAGFLRHKDYIADKKGYRILKSKIVFVGQGRPIEEAIKSTKNTPAQSGVLVDGGNGLNARANSVNIHSDESTKHGGYVYSTTPIPFTTTTTAEPPPRLGYLSPAEAANIEPSPYLGFDHYPDELPRAYHHNHRQPVVHIRPHSEPLNDHSNSIADNYDNGLPDTTGRSPTPSPPSLDMAPPFESSYRHARPVAIVRTTPAPISANEAAYSSYSTPSPFATRSTPRSNGYYYTPSSTPSYKDYNNAAYYYSTTARPPAILPLDINNLESGLLPPLPPPTHHRRLRPQPANEDYDGVAVTRNGFRYFLPHQYHEEEQIDEHKRAGSFGYVDPFGIRRVVYYNASPERGFVHRNNNRYVGLGATPFDPPSPETV